MYYIINKTEHQFYLIFNSENREEAYTFYFWNQGDNWRKTGRKPYLSNNGHFQYKLLSDNMYFFGFYSIDNIYIIDSSYYSELRQRFAYSQGLIHGRQFTARELNELLKAVLKDDKGSEFELIDKMLIFCKSKLRNINISKIIE